MKILPHRGFVDVKIEKNIPIPSGIQHRNSYPFPELEVGDSFKTDFADVRTAADAYSRTHEAKLVVRKVSDTECRVWRVE